VGPPRSAIHLTCAEYVHDIPSVDLPLLHLLRLFPLSKSLFVNLGCSRPRFPFRFLRLDADDRVILALLCSLQHLLLRFFPSRSITLNFVPSGGSWLVGLQQLDQRTGAYWSSGNESMSSRCLARSSLIASLPPSSSSSSRLISTGANRSGTML
jgi:hypothetical protein